MMDFAIAKCQAGDYTIGSIVGAISDCFTMFTNQSMDAGEGIDFLVLFYSVAVLVLCNDLAGLQLKFGID